MTSPDCVHTIKMLLDESHNDFFTDNQIIAAINEAQIMVISKYYQMGEERCLRPLYRVQLDVQDGDIILSPGEQKGILFPRSCMMYLQKKSTRRMLAHYLEPPIFLNYLAADASAGDSDIPRSLYYTVTTQFDPATTNIYDYLRIAPDNVFFKNLYKADFYYLVVPLEFNYSLFQPGLNRTLVIPPEYHFEVCCFTAEALNDIDVNETERGEAIEPQKKLTLEGAGSYQ